MMISTLYLTNTLSWIFTHLAHRYSIPQVDMSLNSIYYPDSESTSFHPVNSLSMMWITVLFYRLLSICLNVGSSNDSWFCLVWFYGVIATFRENHRPVASHPKTLSHNVVHLALIGTDCIYR